MIDLQDKKKIRVFIRSNNVRGALKLLTNITEEDSELHNEILILLSRFNDINNNERKGLISRSDAGIERNNLSNAVLNLLNTEIDDKKANKVYNRKHSKNKTIFFLLAIFLVIIFIIWNMFNGKKAPTRAVDNLEIQINHYVDILNQSRVKNMSLDDLTEIEGLIYTVSTVSNNTDYGKELEQINEGLWDLMRLSLEKNKNGLTNSENLSYQEEDLNNQLIKKSCGIILDICNIIECTKEDINLAYEISENINRPS